MNRSKCAHSLVFFISLFAAISSIAQTPTRDAQAELKAATTAAKAVAKQGPVDITFKDQATLKLPDGYVFVPQPEADQMMKALGNGVDAKRLGLVFSPDSNGFVVVKYIDAGYVKDEEARDWKSDEMLKQMKLGTEEGNKDRAELGIPPMELVGWVQAPTYEQPTHRLVWSVESKDKEGPANSAHGINYNTFVLGREGYLSLNLVTSMDRIEHDRSIATTLLQRTAFNPGKSYADFNASTDKVAEYGIAALVAGVAVKKLGLFAVIAAFAAKFTKVIALAAFALIASFRKFFKNKND